MANNAVSPVCSSVRYTPEQTTAARKLYEMLRKTKKPDRRIFAAALAGGLRAVDSAFLANLAASVVVAKLGTYAVSREELSDALIKVTDVA